MIDTSKQQDTMKCFDHNSFSLEKNYFGTPMSLIPMFKPFLEDDVKDRINLHKKHKRA